MKKILLLSAAYLNGNGYVDAGAEVSVGNGKLEMTEGRATDMVKAKLAEELPDDDTGDEAGDDAEGDAGASKPAARSGTRAK